MSGGFSDAERERIRERLLAEGRELFARYGLGKTTIGDLTDAVGIANSTFYQFFDSKTALYVAVLEREGERVLPDLLAPLEAEDPETAIAGFLTRVMDEIETNPLVRSLLTDPEEMARLREHHTDAELAASREQDLSYIRPHVEAWYEADEVHGPDPDTIARAIRAVTLLTLQQETIGTEQYDRTRDTLVRAVARGLTTEPDPE
jgi:AcrR family transcriptional regulator